MHCIDRKNNCVLRKIFIINELTVRFRKHPHLFMNEGGTVKESAYLEL